MKESCASLGKKTCYIFFLCHFFILCHQHDMQTEACWCLKKQREKKSSFLLKVNRFLPLRNSCQNYQSIPLFQANDNMRKNSSFTKDCKISRKNLTGYFLSKSGINSCLLFSKKDKKVQHNSEEIKPNTKNQRYCLIMPSSFPIKF